MVKAASLKDTKVFSSIKVGENEISHKIVMAPSARTRAALNEEPSDLQLKHYNDRTQFPGSLVIAEGTVLSPKTGGVWGAPGIYNHSQVQGWKKITQTIHDNKSFVLYSYGLVAESPIPSLLTIINYQWLLLRLFTPVKNTNNRLRN